MRLQLYLILFLILLNGLECQDASNYQTGQILNQKMEENGVVGEPTVQCGIDSLSLEIKTNNPFSGRLFISGFSQEKHCQLLGNGSLQRLQFTVQFGQCGLRRSRELNGISVQTIVIVSFHPFPLTDKRLLTQKSSIPICSSDSIGILIPNPEVLSDLPFIIYANGYEEQPKCLQPFPPGSPLLRLEIQLKFGFPCGVNKRRMVFPRVGLEYSLRVLLNNINKNEFQSHMNRINGFQKLPKVQNNQRIFDIHCQYFSDINQTVGQVLEISAVTGTLMVDKSVDEKLSSTKIHQPECKYTIHSNSVDGPVADKVKLGDRVFHRWRCDERYALKVYRCYATDGRNREHQIINDQGCSTDTSLMPHPQYIDNPSQALASSRVFRFNSSSRIFFDCLLYACLKIDPECRRTTQQKCISRISSRNTYKFQRQKREIISNSEMISSERYSMAPQIDKLTVRLDTVEANEENNDKSTECKLRSALEYSQKAVKALTLLNLVSLLTAVLLGFALCCLKRRSNNKILISSLTG